MKDVNAAQSKEQSLKKLETVTEDSIDEQIVGYISDCILNIYKSKSSRRRNRNAA